VINYGVIVSKHLTGLSPGYRVQVGETKIILLKLSQNNLIFNTESESANLIVSFSNAESPNFLSIVLNTLTQEEKEARARLTLTQDRERQEKETRDRESNEPLSNSILLRLLQELHRAWGGNNSFRDQCKINNTIGTINALIRQIPTDSSSAECLRWGAIAAATLLTNPTTNLPEPQSKDSTLSFILGICLHDKNSNPTSRDTANQIAHFFKLDLSLQTQVKCQLVIRKRYLIYV
jgi:hypothetical protein